MNSGALAEDSFECSVSHVYTANYRPHKLEQREGKEDGLETQNKKDSCLTSRLMGEPVEYESKLVEWRGLWLASPRYEDLIDLKETTKVA